MEGYLHLNPNGRWEIVDKSDIRIELCSGDVIELFRHANARWARTRVECRSNGTYYDVGGMGLEEGRKARYIGR